MYLADREPRREPPDHQQREPQIPGTKCAASTRLSFLSVFFLTLSLSLQILRSFSLHSIYGRDDGPTSEYRRPSGTIERTAIHHIRSARVLCRARVALLASVSIRIYATTPAAFEMWMRCYGHGSRCPRQRRHSDKELHPGTSTPAPGAVN